MAKVDNLDISISVKTTTAKNGIEKLCKTLDKLQSKIKGLDYSNLDGMTEKLNKVKETSTSSGGSSGGGGGGAAVGISSGTWIGYVYAGLNFLRGVINSFNLIKFKSIAQIAGTFYANFFLVKRAFNAISSIAEVSSDLAEVQNVVDVSFAQYSSTLDDFVKDCDEKYGLSELSAKKFASSFQALGVTMGISAKEMSGMSVELTKMTSDIASLYNQEYEDVAEDMKAIFTGMTKPLTYELLAA